MLDLVIVGAGGFGAEMAALVEDINREEHEFALLGFLDDDASLHGGHVLDHPVLGGVEWLAGHRQIDVAVAIGSPRVRAHIIQQLYELEHKPATLVHPAVSVHASSSVGSGSVVCRGTTATVRVTIEAHCLINLHCTIGHDCVIGEGATLHPGVHLSGASVVGSRAEIGTGTVVLPGVRVGKGSVVGAGAVVARDIPAGVVAAGVPARVIRQADG